MTLNPQVAAEITHGELACMVIGNLIYLLVLLPPELIGLSTALLSLGEHLVEHLVFSIRFSDHKLNPA